MRMRNNLKGVEILVAPTTNERYLYYFAYYDKGLEHIKDISSFKSLVRNLFKDIENVISEPESDLWVPNFVFTSNNSDLGPDIG